MKGYQAGNKFKCLLKTHMWFLLVDILNFNYEYLFDAYTDAKFLADSYHLQEAYVKALGTGFSATPFNTFEIHFKASSETMSNTLEIVDLKVHSWISWILL